MFPAIIPLLFCANMDYSGARYVYTVLDTISLANDDIGRPSGHTRARENLRFTMKNHQRSGDASRRRNEAKQTRTTIKKTFSQYRRQQVTLQLAVVRRCFPVPKMRQVYSPTMRLDPVLRRLQYHEPLLLLRAREGQCFRS